MDSCCEENGTLCDASRKYIGRSLLHYEKVCGKPPKTTYSSPFKKGDHSGINNTEFLEEDSIRDYQSLTGILQWLASIRRFDIHTVVMALSSFQAFPGQGHPDLQFDWSRSVYGEPKEIIPTSSSSWQLRDHHTLCRRQSDAQSDYGEIGHRYSSSCEPDVQQETNHCFHVCLDTSASS
jgi:hypothetical protein